MTKRILLLIAIIFPILFTACKSKEEKAAELIKNELSKTLYDFESYEPVETKVKEAKNSAYNDSTCLNMAMAIAYAMNKGSKAADEAKEASDRADIWGPPTYYSSSYSDNQYRKYKNEAKEKYAEAMATFAIVKSLGTALEDSIKALDGNKIIGWEVSHRFRCKTRGGMSTFGDYRYIIDKDFKKVIFSEDTDDDDFKKTHDIIESAIKGSFSELSLED